MNSCWYYTNFFCIQHCDALQRSSIEIVKTIKIVVDNCLGVEWIFATSSVIVYHGGVDCGRHQYGIRPAPILNDACKTRDLPRKHLTDTVNRFSYEKCLQNCQLFKQCWLMLLLVYTLKMLPSLSPSHYSLKTCDSFYSSSTLYILHIRQQPRRRTTQS